MSGKEDKIIQLLNKSKEHFHREVLIYELLGYFGGRFDESVKNELNERAKLEKENANKCRSKLRSLTR